MKLLTERWKQVCPFVCVFITMYMYIASLPRCPCSLHASIHILLFIVGAFLGGSMFVSLCIR